MTRAAEALERHVRAMKRCRACPDMIPPVVAGAPVRSPVLLVGQAPGAREGALGRPFAWTAGRTMFQWFASIGLDEARFRERVYMAAVCRCFPGKTRAGGDRVPARSEIERCAHWLEAEVRLLAPRLILPVGKLAISRLMPVERLDAVVGRVQRVSVHGVEADAIPLPHPSGASPWHRVEPGRSLLEHALGLIASHPAWRRIRRRRP